MSQDLSVDRYLRIMNGSRILSVDRVWDMDMYLRQDLVNGQVTED